MSQRFTFVLLLLFVLLPDAAAQKPEWSAFNTANSGLVSNQIHAIAHGEGSTWVGTASGLARFDGDTWTSYHSGNTPLPEDYVTSLAVEGSTVWVGTRKGLARFDGAAWEVFTSSNSILADDEILALHAGADGGIWVATPGGLVRVKGQVWDLIDPIFDDLTLAVAVDRQGRAWVGTFNNLQFNGRLRHFDGKTWTLDRLEDHQLASSFPTALLAEADGSAWMGIKGTSGGAVIHIRQGEWTVFDRFNSDLPPGAVTALALEGGRLWIGTASGLASYDDANWRVFDSSNSGLADQNVSTLHVDARGNKWIGTLSAGLFVYREGGVSVASRQDAPRDELELSAFPNPFTSEARIRYRVREAGPVSLIAYDMLGRAVSVLVDELQAPGGHVTIWRPEGNAAGTYLLRLRTPDGQQARTVLLMS